MRRSLLAVLLFCSLISVGQMNEKLGDKKNLLGTDTVVEKIQQLKDSLVNERNKAQQEQMDAANARNLNYLLELQQQRKAKEKRNAIFRIALGLGFLVLLVIGWRRKAKK